MAELRQIFTREEIYQRVWSTPIAKVAEEFGLSDKGLAKLCQRNQIPVPGKGYWARLEAGQKITKTPLRKVYTPELETVHIGGVKREVNPYVAFAIEATKSARSKLAEEASPVKTAPSIIAFTPRITASKSPLHPSLQAFAAEFRHVAPERDGTVQLRWIKVHRDSITRVIAFLDTLAHAFEPFGISFSSSGTRVKFVDDIAAVDFQITSPKKRVVTDRGSWKSFENVHVGRLALQMFGNAEGTRKNWVDADKKKVEDCVNSIVESYRINLIVQKARDERDREESARRAHLAHRRELAKQRKQREERRLEFLTSLAQAKLEAHELKVTIAAIPASKAHAPDYDRMLAWASQRLSALEDQTTIERLQESLVELNLFSEPDDLVDLEGEPPLKQNYWDD